MSLILDNCILLVDGSSYLYRAYYAFPSLTNSIGEPTSAIYGVTNMLRKLITEYQPIYAAVIFDTKGNITFRKKLFQNYKCNRPSMPYNLQLQIKPLYAVIEAMGLSVVTIAGIEADDVIGTLAYHAEKMGILVLISTIDKDMAQLVNSGIFLVDAINKSILVTEKIVDKYGVPPKSIIDLLALTGDPSDNIPGVPGIGKKTAQSLIDGIGGLDQIYSNLEKIANLAFRGSKNLSEKLKQHKKIAYLSYQLAKIKTDVSLGITIEELKVHKPIVKELLKLFQKYEFNHWILEIKNQKWLEYKYSTKPLDKKYL